MKHMMDLYKYLLYEKHVAPNTVMGEFFKDIKDELFNVYEMIAIPIEPSEKRLKSGADSLKWFDYYEDAYN